jgi:small subunit ribosomal protein S21
MRTILPTVEALVCHCASACKNVAATRTYAGIRRHFRQNRLEISFRLRHSALFLNLPKLGRFGGVSALAEIRLQEGEPLENALRRFKRKVQTEDIIKEVKRHSFYLKPGEKKRVKEALARKRNLKKKRKEQD